MCFVQVCLVSRAIAAATSLAGALDLKVNDAIVIQNSNTLALRLLPCDVFARTALVGQEVAAFEVRLARGLAGATGPVASLDPRVEPRAYEVDGFAITLWTYYEATPDPADQLNTPLHSSGYTQPCETSRSKHRISWSARRRRNVLLRTEARPPRSMTATVTFS